MKHTLVALMQDKPGVLNRVVSLFRRRGFNIESLTVGHTETPSISRMTIVVDSDDTFVEQVSKQLYRLIEILKVSDVTEDPHVARELILVKVHAPAARRADVNALAAAFEAKVADVGLDTMLVELTSSPDRVDTFIELIRPFGIKEMVRTGRVAMVRGTPTHTGDTYVRVA
jgi:acetolactate synthase I/III small subunit